MSAFSDTFENFWGKIIVINSSIHEKEFSGPLFPGDYGQK